VSEASQQSTFTAPDPDEQIVEYEEEEKSRPRKRAWWWEYFEIMTLSTTFQKGKGKKTVTTLDERYTCKLCKNARPFIRLASKLYGAASAMKDHVENKHKKYENNDENAGKSH
jgi:hypothetical protein